MSGPSPRPSSGAVALPLRLRAQVERITVGGGDVGPASSAPLSRSALRVRLVDGDGRQGEGVAAPLGAGAAWELSAAERALQQVQAALVADGSVITASTALQGVANPRDGSGPDDAPGVNAIAAMLAPFADTLAASTFARFALESAAARLLAVRLDAPVAELLRGAPVCAAVAVNALVAAGDEEVVDAAKALAAAGYATLKVKVGRLPWERELAAVRALRAALPAACALRLDANGAWTLDEARARLTQLAELQIELVEQPVAPAELVALGPCDTPWAADESLAVAGMAERLLGDPACAALVLKPARLGLLAARTLARRAAARGKGVVITHFFDGPAALEMACDLALALEATPLASGLAPWDEATRAVPHLREPGRCMAPACAPEVAASRPSQLASEVAGSDALDAVRAAQDPAVAPLPALVGPEGSLSFASLAGRVAASVAALRRAGAVPGCRVAFRATTSVDTVIVFLALAGIDAPWLAVHPRLGAAEVAEILRVAGPVAHLADDDVRALAAGAVTEAARAALGAAASSSDGVAGARVLALMATSGTTGTPKVAELPRAAFLASAAASARNLGWAPDDRWLCCMPLAHVGGLSIVTRGLAARRPVVLLARFDVAAVLETIVRERVTLLSVVPTMLHALLEADHAGVLPRLRVVLVGGAACSDALRQACAERGIVAVATYGTTEACSQITAQSPGAGGGSPIAEPGSGRALAGVELAIFRDDGRRAPAGDVGRIQVRGPARMRGYLGHAPLAPDDWLDTGDLGHVDAGGTLFVAARRTDLIVSGGENVYPAEVERVVDACAGVRRSLVFGVPDERWGQRVAVAVVIDASVFSMAALADALGARLAPHKRPRLACVVDALPETAAGKVDRRGALTALASRLEPLGGS